MPTVTGGGSTLFRLDSSQVTRGLRRLLERTPEVAAVALNEIADETMLRSKELTPVLHNVLRNSGKVSTYATAHTLRVELTYGTEYAVYVHEIPPPPAKSPGGRSARHHVGQWKFLETAVNETGRTLTTRLAEKLRGMLG